MNCKLLSFRTVKHFLGLLILSFFYTKVSAQVNLSASGSYSQNFDALSGASTWTDNSTLAGWYVSSGGAISVNDGSAARVGLVSFGAWSGDADRSIGHANNAVFYGVRVKNNGTTTIQSLTIQYSLELWHRASGNKSLSTVFDYQKSATSLSGGTWTNVSGSDINFSTGGGSAGTLDGNVSSNRETLTFIAPISLAAGEEVMLRWKHNNTESDIYPAIDDVQITANAASAPSSVYYSRSSGNLDNLSSWRSNADGSGSTPTSFSNATFIILGRTTSTIGANWNLGTGAKVILSYGTFTIPSAYSLTGTIDVNDNTTLSINNTTLPTLGTLGNNSTVVYYTTTGSQNVQAATYGNLTISGGGSKVLQGNATVNGVLNFTGGNLTTLTAATTLTLGNSASITGEDVGQYYIGKLISMPVTISGAVSSTFGGMGLTFNNTGGGNWGSVTVTRTTGSAISNPKNSTMQGIKRSWHISPAIQAGTNVNMTYKWLTTEDNGLNFSGGQAQAWKSEDNGATWQKVDGLITITTSGNWRSIPLNTSSFSIWTFTDPITPLPVTWVYFKAKATKAGNELTWATASEKNSSVFVVERSADGKNFETIGSVKAAGNSNQLLAYSFTDKTAPAQKLVYYRLKQMDADGTFAYSTIVALAEKEEAGNVISAYPNPFGQSLKLQLAAGQSITQVVLKTTDGKEVFRKDIKGAAVPELNDLPSLKPGLYLLQLVGASGEITTLKVMRR